jgi:radical SAM protein with 4Fe4S-binding SPASM domain
MKNNYCTLPFNSISIGTTGNIRPCCNTHAPFSNFKIENTDYENIINTKDIIKLRNSFLKGEKPSACERCWKMEDVGNKSFRQIANNDKFYGLDTNPPKSKRISITDIKYINLELGNICNLGCRMCGPTSSSLVAKHLTQLGEYTRDIEIGFDRESKDKIIKLFQDAVNLSRVYMIGGEPLYNEFHDEILEVLLNHPNKENICIHYNTNLQGTKFDKYVEAWKQFKLIDMQVSVDGSDEIYEYIRWPGKWNKLVKNLEKILKIDNFKIGAAITVQALNAQNLPMLCNKLFEIGPMPVFFIPISGLNQLHIAPNSIIESAIKELDETNFYHETSKQGLINMYQDALKEPTEQEVKSFFKRQQGFDGLRKQNLFESLPYMKEVAKKWNIEIW